MHLWPPYCLAIITVSDDRGKSSVGKLQSPGLSSVQDDSKFGAQFVFADADIYFENALNNHTNNFKMAIT